MPLRERYLTVLSPVEGLDLSQPGTMIKATRTPFVRNVQMRYGELSKRPGRNQFTGSPTPLLLGGSARPIRAIHQFFKADGADFLLAWSDRKVGRYRTSTDDFVNLTRQVASVDADFTMVAQDRFSIAYYIATDSVYFTNFVDGIQKWTGSTASRASLVYPPSTLRAGIILPFQGHLVFYRLQDGPSYIPRGVKWTAAGEESLTTGTANQTALDGGSDAIVDAVPIGPFVAIYLEDSIVLQDHVGGNTVYRFTPRINEVGLFCQGAVANLGSEHIFLGSDLRVYAYDGGTDLAEIGKEITRDLQARLDVTNGRNSFMTVVEELHEAWLCVVEAGHTYPTFVYKYNYQDRTWSVDTLSQEMSTNGSLGFYIRTQQPSWDDMIGSWDSQTRRWDERNFLVNAPLLLMGDPNGKITQYGEAVLTDDGAAIEVVFDTPDVTDGELYTHKERRYLDFNFEAKGTSVDVSYSIDEGLTFQALRTVTLTSTWHRYNVECDVTTPKIRFRLRNYALTGDLDARNFELGFVAKALVMQ